MTSAEALVVVPVAGETATWLGSQGGRTRELHKADSFQVSRRTAALLVLQ